MLTAPEPSHLFKKVMLISLSVVIVAAVKLALMTMRYRRLRRYLPQSSADAAPPAMCSRISLAVATAARLVPGANCLTQALAAQVLLALRGFSSDVKVGVRLEDDGRFGAHAWLTCGDRIVIGGGRMELDRFEPLIELTHR